MYHTIPLLGPLRMTCTSKRIKITVFSIGSRGKPKFLLSYTRKTESGDREDF